MRAAQRTDYRPNLMARSLRTQRAHAIIVLVPTLENPFYPDIIKGMEEAAHYRGYSLTLGLTRALTLTLTRFAQLAIYS